MPPLSFIDCFQWKHEGESWVSNFALALGALLFPDIEKALLALSKNSMNYSFQRGKLGREEWRCKIAACHQAQSFSR